VIFVHPQLIWRTPLFELVEQFERRGLRLWNRRTRSGRNVLTLESLPAKETPPWESTFTRGSTE
jgi:hypothetical protein